MPKFYVTRGIPASGKTTHVKKMLVENRFLVNVNRDDIRTMLRGNNYEFNMENVVSEIEHDIIDLAFVEGLDIVLSNTNTRKANYAYFVEKADVLGYEIEYIDFYVHPAIAKARNAKRDNPVPEHVIDRMYEQFQELLEEE